MTAPTTESELPILTMSFGLAPAVEAAHTPWLLVVETPPELVARVAAKMMPPFAGNANWLKEANVAPGKPGALSPLRKIFVKVPLEPIVQIPLALDEVTLPPVAKAPVKAISLALLRSGDERDWKVWPPEYETPVRATRTPVPFEEYRKIPVLLPDATPFPEKLAVNAISPALLIMGLPKETNFPPVTPGTAEPIAATGVVAFRVKFPDFVAL